MTLEEQAAYIQSLKAEAKLNQQDPKERLIAELADTVSLLCHQVSLMSEVSDGMNDSLAVLEEQMDYLLNLEDEPEEGMGVDEYFDGSEHPLYQIKCPQCGDQFAVDEQSLMKGFRCPTCGEHLIQAE